MQGISAVSTVLAFRMSRVHERSLRQCDGNGGTKRENYTALAMLRVRSDIVVNADEGRGVPKLD